MIRTETRNATFTCPFCGGSGHLPHYRHVKNGDCFACGASGKIRDLDAFIGDCSDMLLTVWTHRGKFSGATLRRRTWKMTPSSVGSGVNQRVEMYQTWGRDSFIREINNVEEARQIWRDSKRLGILTELVD